jgi:hypothetical protein
MKTPTIMLWSALLIAAAVVALVVTGLIAQTIEEPWNIAVVSELLGSTRLTFLVALGHAIVLGLPLFLFLRAKSLVGIISCALGGFVVGAIGPASFGLMGMFGNASYNASSGGRATIVNGAPTLAGWIEYAQAVGYAGLIGLAGGLTFWLVTRLSGQIPPEPATATPPARSPAMSRTVAVVAIAATCAVLLLPSIVTDKSCHNLFRDGRTSIAPQIYARVNLTAEDWPALTQLTTDYAAAHSLSLRSDQAIRSGRLMWRNLNLCNEAGINIESWMRLGWIACSMLLHVSKVLNSTSMNSRPVRAGICWHAISSRRSPRSGPRRWNFAAATAESFQRRKPLRVGNNKRSSWHVTSIRTFSQRQRSRRHNGHLDRRTSH